MKKNYIKAIMELLAAGQAIDVVLAHLKEVLARRRHLSIHSDILKGLQAEMERSAKENAAVLFVAKVGDSAKLAAAVDAALSSMKESGAQVRTVVDETLIGGFKINHNGKTVDASYKTKLLTLYKNITK